MQNTKPIILIICMVLSLVIIVPIFCYYLYRIEFKAHYLTQNSVLAVPTSSPQQSIVAVTEKELINLVDTQNPRIALNALQGMLTNDTIANSCHEISHQIGHEAYNRYKNVGQALTYNNEICGNGYLHGVIEESFSHVTNIQQTLGTICQPENLGICFHGVGHGLMYYTNDDTKQSLTYCDTLSFPYEKDNCYDGVMMEYFEKSDELMSMDMSGMMNMQKNSDPLLLCSQLQAQYKGSCYFYATRYFLAIHANQYTQAFNWCLDNKQGYSLTCIRGVGSTMMKQNLNEPNIVAGFCAGTLTSDEQQSCIDGMVSYYVTNYYSVNAGRAMCNTLLKAYQQECLNSITELQPLFPA